MPVISLTLTGDTESPLVTLRIDSTSHQRPEAPNSMNSGSWMTSSNDPPHRTCTAHRSRGTRRTPDATAGSSSYTSPTRQAKTNRRRIRRPVTKDRR